MTSRRHAFALLAAIGILCAGCSLRQDSAPDDKDSPTRATVAEACAPAADYARTLAAAATLNYVQQPDAPADGASPCSVKNDAATTGELSVLNVSFYEGDPVKAELSNPIPGDPITTDGPVVQRRTASGVEVLVRYAGRSEVHLQARSQLSFAKWTLAIRTEAPDGVTLPITDSQIDAAAQGLAKTIAILDKR
ncbi:hypothetical protein [Williamsia sp. CHRR-6]|uniref:hypothetical protein n=1 Tax=Williamsia sp. CHRR-6 TaxID=2835871 RepID=UPI001BD978B8|nr:hypothetical protein [Williamsia sp. CHRR-6]MBT0566264.1 hypothetical protein [Williamsia sp. CHRR-6]